jgi:hypothetical protein
MVYRSVDVSPSPEYSSLIIKCTEHNCYNNKSNLLKSGRVLRCPQALLDLHFCFKQSNIENSYSSAECTITKIVQGTMY